MEVSAILNARSLVTVFSDPDAPQILSPDMLIIQKTIHTSRRTSQSLGPKTPSEVPGNRFSIWILILPKMAHRVHTKFTYLFEISYRMARQTVPK